MSLTPFFSAMPCLIGDPDGTDLQVSGAKSTAQHTCRVRMSCLPTGEANAPRGLVWHGTMSRQGPSSDLDADADRMAPGICHRPVGLGPAALYHSKQTMPFTRPRATEKAISQD